MSHIGKWSTTYTCQECNDVKQIVVDFEYCETGEYNSHTAQCVPCGKFTDWDITNTPDGTLRVDQ